jgi:plastocyanin
MKGLARGLGLGALLSALLVAGTGNAMAATKIVAIDLEWSPPSVTIAAGESVEFENPDPVQAQGIEWKEGAPSPPVCTGVPGKPAQTGVWSGSCTFTDSGTYQFASTAPDRDFMIGVVTVTGPGPPTPSSGEGEATGDTSATLAGSVNPNGFDTEYFFRYGPTASYGQTTPKSDAGGGTSAVAVAATLLGLEAATTYHFQLVAENSAGTKSGSDRTFTTTGPPTVSTGNTTGVEATKATLLGTVNPFGHETTYYFEWGLDTSYGQRSEVKSAGAGVATVTASAQVGGLAPGTAYHYRLVAENESGGDVGLDRAILTRPDPSDPGPGGGGPAVPQPPGPALGPAVRATAAGKRVKVALDVLAAGAGGRVSVRLDAKGARPRQRLAGRRVRSGVAAGRLTVSVPLNGRAKRTLRKRGKLALRVGIVFTPPTGTAVKLTRSVAVKG